MAQGAPALTRGMAILELLARSREPVGFNAIMTELDLPKATCARLLHVLRDTGYAEKAPEGGYRLGQRVSLLLGEVDLADRLRLEGTPLLRRLREQTNGSALLFQWDGWNLTVLAKETHPESPSMRPVGQGSRNLNHLPWGILCYHHLQPARQAAYRDSLDNPEQFDALYSGWQTDYARRGYSFDDCEILPGVRRFGAMIYNRDGVPVGAVGLGGTPYTIPDDRVEAAGRAVLATAEELSQRLGRPMDETKKESA